jgi:tousled-like kinase
MIFGEKPFGHNMTQEKILGEKIILNAENVKFTGRNCVSPEAKEFILGCLTKEQNKRWDVNQALTSNWMKKK